MMNPAFNRPFLAAATLSLGAHAALVGVILLQPFEPRTDTAHLVPVVTVPVPASLTKAAYKTAAGEMAQTREIPGWRQKDWKKVPIGVVAGAVGAQTLKSLAIEKLTETEVHSAITGLGVEVVGQAQLVGDVEASEAEVLAMAQAARRAGYAVYETAGAPGDKGLEGLREREVAGALVAEHRVVAQREGVLVRVPEDRREEERQDERAEGVDEGAVGRREGGRGGPVGAGFGGVRHGGIRRRVPLGGVRLGVRLGGVRLGVRLGGGSGHGVSGSDG